MPNVLKRSTGQASIAGTVIYTVPAGATATLVGCRAANTDTASEHWVTFDINGFVVSGTETPIPSGSALDIMDGSKIVLQAGDVLTVSSDVDTTLDVYVSYLEQT